MNAVLVMATCHCYLRWRWWFDNLWATCMGSWLHLLWCNYIESVVLEILLCFRRCIFEECILFGFFSWGLACEFYTVMVISLSNFNFVITFSIHSLPFLLFVNWRIMFMSIAVRDNACLYVTIILHIELMFFKHVSRPCWSETFFKFMQLSRFVKIWPNLSFLHIYRYMTKQNLAPSFLRLS